jgi:hypothetical protein
VVIDDQDSRGCHAAIVARAGSRDIGVVLPTANATFRAIPDNKQSLPGGPWVAAELEVRGARLAGGALAERDQADGGGCCHERGFGDFDLSL